MARPRSGRARRRRSTINDISALDRDGRSPSVRYPSEIPLLVSDMVMAGMSGPGLAQGLCGAARKGRCWSCRSQPDRRLSSEAVQARGRREEGARLLGPSQA